jgi:glycosyltransferase involved in cell wall biosynthesis
MNSPLSLSVAMATYNGERFLSEQLQSLSRQTRLPDELVITDDGSCDGTLAILEAFATTSPFPVRIHRNPRQLGYGDNFLRAASLCQSDLIAFADQDDVWMPSKIARCLPFFADGEVLLSLHAGIVVDEDLTPLGYQHPRIRCTRVVLDRTLYRRALPGFAMIIRKNLPGLFQTPRAPNLSNGKPMPHDTWAGLLASTFNFSRLQQVGIAKQATADSYSKSAKWAAELITSLNQIQLISSRDQHLRQIAVYGLDRNRQALEQRTQLYGSDKGFLPKLRLFLNLISRGHYGNPQEGNLGWKSLLKDSAHIVQLASPLG